MHWPPHVTNISAKIENHLHKHLDEIRDSDDGADASIAFVFVPLPGWISLVEEKNKRTANIQRPQVHNPQDSQDHKFLQNVKGDPAKPFGLVHGHIHLL